MNDSGTKTKKDARLDERKRNSFEIHTVNSKKPKESAKLNQDEIVIEPSEEIVLEPNEEIIIEKEGKILLEHEEVVIQGDEIIITEKEIIVSESGESLPKSKGHKGMKFLFNPPTDCERYNFCEAWDYICEEPEKDFLAPFEFETINYGPGIVQPIEGDGNCGFRSISWALTGSEVNHDEIRKDLMEYLEETLYQYSLEPIGNDWWQMFFDRVEDARKHIEIKKSPARSAAENDKWMSEPDMFIAAKMFKINVISYKPADNPDHIWQIFTPQMQNSLLNPIQDLEAPSIFIYNQLGHFEVIIQPERLSHKND
ncbi:hypothetical protein niasHS_011751 [Heterodera schachtii]|uniref:OTU domain-containing protein n=1 Tax=Heterodera schachtii TaxID=97005 RepID=A0ABD2IFI5_HETSC